MNDAHNEEMQTHTEPTLPASLSHARNKSPPHTTDITRLRQENSRFCPHEVIILWTRRHTCAIIQDVSINWKIVELKECESTFNVARKEAPWTIVSAERQLKGRGRFNRTWFGDPGGLWATYNLPLDPKATRHWGLLPLVAGVAIIKALDGYNIRGLRLRWPNDVLVGREKLAGILVERPATGMASIGIGLNISNDIEQIAPRTSERPTRLQDLLYACPKVSKMRMLVANALATTFHTFVEHGIEALRDDLEAAWGQSLPVVAITDTERVRGYFVGVESDGSPILRKADGTTVTVPGITVNRMKELI